jgi:hypothetical protein
VHSMEQAYDNHSNRRFGIVSSWRWWLLRLSSLVETLCTP